MYVKSQSSNYYDICVYRKRYLNTFHKFMKFEGVSSYFNCVFISSKRIKNEIEKKGLIGNTGFIGWLKKSLAKNPK